MPIYEYRCDNGHTFEVKQRMIDDALTACSTCEAPDQRVFHPVAVHFKGSGFYNTDYGKKKKGGPGTDVAAPKSESESGSNSSESSSSKTGKSSSKGGDSSSSKSAGGPAKGSSDSSS